MKKVECQLYICMDHSKPSNIYHKELKINDVYIMPLDYINDEFFFEIIENVESIKNKIFIEYKRTEPYSNTSDGAEIFMILEVDDNELDQILYYSMKHESNFFQIS